MIARAGRVLPGMIVTLLLAGPALAAPHDKTAAAERAGLDLRRHTAGAHTASTGRSHAVTARASGKYLPKPARTASATPRPRHAPVHTAAFVDDNFSYTEDGSGQGGWKQRGVASWYGGSRWQGHMTSMGTRYDENQLTAAHATLPLGSRIRVRLADGSKSVIVTITDRPGTRTRIIDLSKRAAAELGMLRQGVATVTLSSL